MTPRERILPARDVRSLTWVNDALVDFAAGGVRYELDGSRIDAPVYWAYRFDSAVAVADYAVIYRRLGTKGLLLRNGAIIRELNRSFYHADVYAYPVCLTQHDGRTLLIHCPDDYNRLEIEDAGTGEHLTSRTTEPGDFFHSRLAANRQGTRLLSAGWVWHPLDAVMFFDIGEALRNPAHLDALDWRSGDSRNIGLVEESSACWLTESLAVITGGEEEAEAAASPALRLRPNGVIVYDTSAKAVLSSIVLEQPAGTVMPVGETHVIAFYQHPRLIRLSDGHIEHEWAHISSGNQTSSIAHHETAPAPMALDPDNRRFAIAQADGIHVIDCS